MYHLQLIPAPEMVATLSGGSWVAVDAAKRIRQGIEAFRVGNGAYWYLAEVLEAGASFPELILVGADERGPPPSFLQ